MERICGIKHLNDTTYFKRTFSSNLDHIRYVEDTIQDRILNLVIDTMLTHNWQAKLGLNLQQTLDLEYADFLKLERMMEKYGKAQLSNINAVNNQINSQIKGL